MLVCVFLMASFGFHFGFAVVTAAFLFYNPPVYFEFVNVFYNCFGFLFMTVHSLWMTLLVIVLLTLVSWYAAL